MCVSFFVFFLVNIRFSASWCVQIHELGNAELQYVKSEGTINGEDGMKHTALTHFRTMYHYPIHPSAPLPSPTLNLMPALHFFFSFLNM